MALFDGYFPLQTQGFFNYDVTADGKRFLVTGNPSVGLSKEPAILPLTVRINWNAAPKN